MPRFASLAFEGFTFVAKTLQAKLLAAMGLVRLASIPPPGPTGGANRGRTEGPFDPTIFPVRITLLLLLYRSSRIVVTGLAIYKTPPHLDFS